MSGDGSSQINTEVKSDAGSGELGRKLKADRFFPPDAEMEVIRENPSSTVAYIEFLLEEARGTSSLPQGKPLSNAPGFLSDDVDLLARGLPSGVELLWYPRENEVDIPLLPDSDDAASEMIVSVFPTKRINSLRGNYRILRRYLEKEAYGDNFTNHALRDAWRKTLPQDHPAFLRYEENTLRGGRLTDVIAAIGGIGHVLTSTEGRLSESKKMIEAGQIMKIEANALKEAFYGESGKYYRDEAPVEDKLILIRAIQMKAANIMNRVLGADIPKETVKIL